MWLEQRNTIAITAIKLCDPIIERSLCHHGFFQRPFLLLWLDEVVIIIDSRFRF